MQMCWPFTQRQSPAECSGEHLACATAFLQDQFSTITVIARLPGIWVGFILSLNCNITHHFSHLYLGPVTNCYLFQGCKRKFLDILIPSCHVEMFMPNVSLMSPPLQSPTHAVR